MNKIGVTEIYNELYFVDKENILSLTIEDKNLSGKKNPVLKITARKSSIPKRLMKKIIKSCDEWGASMFVLPHGVIEISLPKEKKNL